MKECYCPECPEHNWNPWTPEELTLEKGVEVHNNLFHDGEKIAGIRKT